MNILIANDPAFNFTYRSNIDAMRKIAAVSFFSPMNDAVLPPCDLLYLPGGYPELFLEALVSNATMRTQIKEYAEKGGHIFAECGGFMYLCKEIDSHPMCGVLPMCATMSGAHLHLGYRQMEWNPRLVVRGHEFHYSRIVDDSMSADAKAAADAASVVAEHRQTTAMGRRVDTPVYRYKNVVAGYTHWYWADMPATLLAAFLGLEDGEY